MVVPQDYACDDPRVPEPDPRVSEPDPRFTMANERTFLAWNRTALAYIAGGTKRGGPITGSGSRRRIARSLASQRR